MRTKLTDIIGTMDQFNGVDKYTVEYKEGKEASNDTVQKVFPDKDTIPEDILNALQKLLDDGCDSIRKRIEAHCRKYGESHK